MLNAFFALVAVLDSHVAGVNVVLRPRSLMFILDSYTVLRWHE